MTSSKFNDLKILLWVLIGIPLIASTNIDCGGRSFHCLNSTHFRICVDLGGGLSTTVDDFVIPCPSSTVCSHNNRFECEFPQLAASLATAASIIIPPVVQITLTGATNEFESATTLAWEEVTVPTPLPSNTSGGHLEAQNSTFLNNIESQLIKVTTSASVINTIQNETVTEIVPIPNTTFKPQMTTTEDILVIDTNLQNITESIIRLNKTTVISEVTSNATEANITTSDRTDNNINETTVTPKIEVITTSNTKDTEISTSNVIDNKIKETTANPQIEIITSSALGDNTITSNVSENNVNETKADVKVDGITTTATRINDTITLNITENNNVTNTYETSTDVNGEITDTKEAKLNINNITSSVIDNIAMDTSVTLETPISTAESESAASKVDEMATNVSTTSKFTKAAETMNTVSVTTIYPEIIVHDKISGLIEVSVNQSVIPIEVNRKKTTQVIDPFTTAVPKIMVNTDVSATLNSETLVEEVIAITTAIDTDITTTLPSVQHNQTFVTESNTDVITETVKENTLVTPLPKAVSDTIFNANSLVEDTATQSTIFSVNTESTVQKTTLTALQATEIVANTEDNVILNLKTPNEESTTMAVHNENADNVKGDINTINVTTSIPVPFTMQKIDVVTVNSNNLDGEILVTTTVSNVNTESNDQDSTGASNTTVTVIPNIVSNSDINSTFNLYAPAEDNLTSATVPSFISMSNVTENTNVVNIPKIIPNIDSNTTFDSSILVDELIATSPTVSKADIINTSASIITNDDKISKTSPNIVTSPNSEIIELTETKNETPTPSSVSEVITTEYKIRENIETFESTTLNNVSALFDTNEGNNTVAMETRKTAVSSVKSIWTTTTDNILETQTPTTKLDIIKSATEPYLDFTTEYPSTFSELFDIQTTTNTKTYDEITSDNAITAVTADNNKTNTINPLTTDTFQRKENIEINNNESGTSTGNHSILDIADIQLNTTHATMNDTAATDETGTISTFIKSSTKSSDVMSTTENNQVHITTTTDHQLNLETATPSSLVTQLRQDSIGNRFNISTTDEQHSTNTLLVTEYFTTDTPNTEAQLIKNPSIVVNKEDSCTTPTSNDVYTRNQNGLLKTKDIGSDSGNTANQVHIAPTITQVPTKSLLLDQATTYNILKTPQSANEVQSFNITSNNLSIGKESFGTSESIILTTAAILQSDINATSTEIATESSLYNDTTSTERNSAMSITLMPKVTIVAPDARTSTKIVEVISTVQDNKASNDTAVPEEVTISAVNVPKNLTTNTQLFNLRTTARTTKMFEDVETESLPKNPDLIKTDIHFNSVVPSTKGNVIFSAGNEIPINTKSTTINTVKSGDNVDQPVHTANLQINDLTTAAKTQNDLMNTTTTTTKGASSVKMNTEIDNTVNSSIARSQSDGLLTQTTTTIEYESNSSLPPFNSQNNVQSEAGVANKAERETSAQTMTRTVDTAYVSPSIGSKAVQEALKYKNNLSGTTNILRTKETDEPSAQTMTRTVDTAYVSPSMGSIPVQEALKSKNTLSGTTNILRTKETDEPSAQTMTRTVDTAYVSPSMGSMPVQEALKSENTLSGTTNILRTKETDEPVQYITSNVFMKGIREEPTTDTAIGGIFASTALSPTTNVLRANKDAIIFDTWLPAMVSAGSNTKTDSSSSNVVTGKKVIVQESNNFDTLRSINTTVPEPIPETEYENKVGILSAMNSTILADGGREISILTNPVDNVPLNTHKPRVNDVVTPVSVATTDRPTATEVSNSTVIRPLSVKDGYLTSQTEKIFSGSTSSMKVSSAYNPGVTVSVGSNTKRIVLSPNTVTLKIPTVEESISFDVQKSSNKSGLEISPLMQNVNQVNILPNVAKNSTASTNNDANISNNTKTLEKVVLNVQDESAIDTLTMLTATTTTSRSTGIPTSTENSSFIIQLSGSLSPTDVFGNVQKHETSIVTTLPNLKDVLTPLAVINSNFSVLPPGSIRQQTLSRVQILPQLPNMNSTPIIQQDEKSIINNVGVIRQSETNSENLSNAGISKVPLSMSENTQNTNNVVKENRNVVKDSKWHPTSESDKNNFNNINLSMQSTSTLSITTSNGKVNVTQTTFTNSSVEFHTAVSKINVNAQPSTDRNTESLPKTVPSNTSSLNDDPNFPNNVEANTSVVIIDKQKVNKDHNVNIQLSFVQNASHPFTETSTSSTQTATVAPKSSNTAITTEANVRQTQTTRNTIGSTHSVVTTAPLSILNTIKVDVKRINGERNLNFDCQNRRRGKYADNTNCRKFYICIGMKQPIEGLCPVNTVFSEIKKQCTKNLSDCIRQNQFKCVTNGRFSDFLDDNVYFICVKNRREEFVRFKFQCQSGYKLNKVMVRCEENDTEPPNKSASNDSEATNEKISSSNNKDDSKSYDNSNSTNENAKDNVFKTIKDKSSSERKKVNADFECEEEGKFPDPKSCRIYYVCSKSNRSEEYRQRRKKCDSDEVFHKDKKKCVDADSFDCS